MPKGLQGFQKGHKPFKGTEKTQFKKGHIPWSKGTKGLIKGYWTGKKRPDISIKRKGHIVSEETRGKIRKSLKGRKLPKGHPFVIRGKAPWNKGKKGVMPIPWNKNKKGEYKLLGVSECLKGKRGKLARNWQGGKTPLRDRMKKSPEYRKWRTRVFKRDNYTCWICEMKGYLQPHHLKSFTFYPKLAFNINNGLTLCKFCHKTYTNYGYKAIKNYDKNN